MNKANGQPREVEWIPMIGPLAFKKGFLGGLQHALKVVREGNEDAIAVLEKIVATAIRQFHAEVEAMEQQSRLLDDPAERARIESEIEGMRSGRIPTVDARVVLEKLDETLRRLQRESNLTNGTFSSTPDDHRE